VRSSYSQAETLAALWRALKSLNAAGANEILAEVTRRAGGRINLKSTGLTQNLGQL
jgi:hypothetical protein